MGTGTIADDDDPPTLSISSAGVEEVDSGSATLSFTVTPSEASGKTVTVAYADAGTGTAVSGTDYTAITAGTLTIAPGATSGNVDVMVTGDVLNEPDETIVLTLSSPTNATIAPTGALGTATIMDDDAATATLSVSPDQTLEGGASDAVTVTATLSVISTEAVTITVSPAAEFTLSAATTLTIAAGATTSTGRVTVTAVDNAVGRAGQERDGVGHGVGRQRGGGRGGRDPDDQGQRRRAEGDAGALAFDH